jgi:hypothetical protein
MDLNLESRLELLHDSGQASTDVVAFTRREMLRLGDELGVPVENDRAGMLVSHLALALQRATHGEPSTSPEGVTELIAAELDQRSRYRDQARVLAARALEELQAPLPDFEIDFIALHLAALVAEDIAE